MVVGNLDGVGEHGMNGKGSTKNLGYPDSIEP
jgi:hypothetical protein